MGTHRRQFLELIAAASAVSVAGCSSDGEDDGNSDDSDTDGVDNGSSVDGGTGGDDGSSADSDTGGDGDSGGDGSSVDDSSGETDDGATENDEPIQPGDVTGTAQSSVAELDVVSHEATGVDPQVRIELELRNAGDENNIALTHHNFDGTIFDADGNDILLEQQGTRGPETMTSPGETGVVSIFLFPEEGTRPASYEIIVNCGAIAYDGFSYCESE